LKSGRRQNNSDCVSAKGLKPSGPELEPVIVVPALEEIKALLKKAGWQCEVRPEKDQGVHFTIYRGNMKAGLGAGGSERPYMSFQPEKLKNTVLIHVATIGSGAGLGSFTLDQVTEDFVQAEASKFFVRLASGG
jgi:hypothetical protein